MAEDENRFSLLLVDDELPILRLLVETFKESDYDIRSCRSGLDALAVLQKVRIDAALIDYMMPEMDGLSLLKEIKTGFPAVNIIMVTGHGGIEEAVRAIQLGADDFLEKPFEVDALRARVAQLYRIWKLKEENRKLRAGIRYRFGYSELVGNATVILKLKEMIAQVGPADATILIQGETGTGKELIARAIHFHSQRCEKNFVPVDCAAISETVIESELFGHVKGAFTGAHAATLGLIRAADKGTLFLDEVGDLSPAIQVKLLRTIQEKEVRPVGSSRSHAVDTRILAATNRDLSQEVSRGNFREDLFYRLNVLTMNVPPLRDRKDDIPLLARHFLKRFATDASPVTELSQAALNRLESYDWPGNIRELENVVRRSVALGKADIIRIEDLPAQLYDQTQGRSPNTARPLDDSLAAYEMAAVENALAKSASNRSMAAKILGIGEATLYRKLKKYGINN